VELWGFITLIIHHPFTLPLQAKNFPFPQIFPTIAYLFFSWTDSTDSPECLPILLSISVFTLYFIFHISYQRFLVRPLLREPRPQVHYKSQPDATTQRETQKSTNVKSLTKIEWFQQFSELDRISHGADVVGQSVPGGRTRMWERPLAELRAQPR